MLAPTSARRRLLDPIDRVSEIIFGLIMAVTIVGALSIATAGRNEVRTVAAAALGCNLAWGLVDAVMFLVRTLTERARNRTLARRIANADRHIAHALIVDSLPDHVAALTGPEEVEAMRRRLVELEPPAGRILGPEDFLSAFGIFLLVVLATFPIVLPFMFAHDAALAMRISQTVAIAMLLLAGVVLGRHAGHERPLLTGVLMALLGVALITAVKALGG